MSDEPEGATAHRGTNGGVDGPVTREALYDLVWSDPMLKVAAQFGVSSSYMARVCTVLNVPRPERGYWAKLAVGKAPAKPPLPEAGPGDQLEWVRGGDFAYMPRRRAGPRALSTPRPKPARKADPATERHRLIVGAKELFEAGRESWTVGYLKPTKRLLVDLEVSRSGLDKALAFANRLFLAFENEGYPVSFALPGGQFQRAEVDTRATPTKAPPPHENLWSPARGTVASVNGVSFGLTVIEMAESVEVRYVDGKYVRVSEYVPPKRRRYQSDGGWTSRRDMPTGRLALQAYSPYAGTDWKQTWREDGRQDLEGRIATIVRELEKAVPEVLRQVEAAELEAQVRQREWDEQMARWHRQQAEERAAKALKDSTQQLLDIIESWAATKRLEAFFEDAARRVEQFSEPDRADLLRRIESARELVGSPDALQRLRDWKAPKER